MKIPGWVWMVVIGGFLVGQMFHWMALADVQKRLVRWEEGTLPPNAGG